MALKIEPCPFCGGQHLHMVVHSLSYSVACQTCRCRGPQRKNQELAVMQWNTTSISRKPDTEESVTLAAAPQCAHATKAVDDTTEVINQRLHEVISTRLV